MAKNKNFTIKDSSKTRIRVRACPEEAGGRTLGSMILQPIYKGSYSIALAYSFDPPDGEVDQDSYWLGNVAPPTPRPRLIDIGNNVVQPPFSQGKKVIVNWQAELQSVVIGSIGSTQVDFLGYSSAYRIVAGGIRVPPAITTQETIYSQDAPTGRLVPSPVSPGESVEEIARFPYLIWDITPSTDEPPLVTVEGVQDQEDPFTKFYQIPLTPYDVSVPEWLTNAPVRAYAYKLLSDSGQVLMEGTITSNLTAPGSDPAKVVCESGLV